VGLQVGDVVVSVDGKPLDGRKLASRLAEIRAENVTLGVERALSKPGRMSRGSCGGGEVQARGRAQSMAAHSSAPRSQGRERLLSHGVSAESAGLDVGVMQLAAMGFDRTEALVALKSCKGSVEDATQYLLNKAESSGGSGGRLSISQGMSRVSSVI